MHSIRNHRIRKGILLCGISFPVSYLISLVVYWITYFLNAAKIILFVLVPPIATIVCVMVSFHVVALIYVFAPWDDTDTTKENEEENEK